MKCWLSFAARGFGIDFEAKDDDEAKRIARDHLRRNRVRTRFVLWARDEDPDMEAMGVYKWRIIPSVKEG